MAGLIRAFAAIPLPEEVAEPLEDLQDDLPAGRPVPGENMHVTLVFLGELRRPELEEVHHAFDAIKVPPFELALKGLGQFGGAAPRAIYAAVTASAPLRHLQSKVERAARQTGVEIPSRRFVPHVTVARLKGDRSDSGRVANFVARRSMVAPPPFPVEAFYLFSSQLTRDGPIYEELARYLLGR